MDKLIVVEQEHLVVCDNESCDYKVEYNRNDSIIENATALVKFLNKPCPECGENLLTKEDLEKYLILNSIIKWINKYFSWITFFISKKKKTIKTRIKAHNGILIKEEKNDRQID